MECIYCQRPIDDEASVCGHCGMPAMVAEYHLTERTEQDLWGDEQYLHGYSKDKKRFISAEFGGITVKEGVEIIGDWAFLDSPFAIDVVLPDSVKIIGDEAFRQSCMDSISLPDSIYYIGYCAFCQCKYIKTLVLPKSLLGISYGCFANCESLEDIAMNDNLKAIGDGAFHRNLALKKLRIPKNVTFIGEGAFAGCNVELTIESPNFVSDGTCVFDHKMQKLIGCHMSNIQSYEIPNTIMVIGDGSFMMCENLVDVVIPYGVTTIENYAFGACKALHDIYLPDSLQTIGEHVFTDCVNLKQITVPKNSLDRFASLMPDFKHLLVEANA